MDEYAELWTEFPNYKIRKSVDLLPLFMHKPMMYPAGERFQYNNSGYVVLDQIIEDQNYSKALNVAEKLNAQIGDRIDLDVQLSFLKAIRHAKPQKEVIEYYQGFVDKYDNIPYVADDFVNYLLSVGKLEKAIEVNNQFESKSIDAVCNNLLWSSFCKG